LIISFRFVLQARDLQKKEKEKQIMETATIIVLSVLSTLGVVAIISLVVVSFYKMGRKVDILEESVFKCLEEYREESHKHLEELRREVDSRCDKLDNKITKTSTAPNLLAANKTVLQG
jgi:hypothetical protein